MYPYIRAPGLLISKELQLGSSFLKLLYRASCRGCLFSVVLLVAVIYMTGLFAVAGLLMVKLFVIGFLAVIRITPGGQPVYGPFPLYSGSIVSTDPTIGTAPPINVLTTFALPFTSVHLNTLVRAFVIYLSKEFIANIAFGAPVAISIVDTLFIPSALESRTTL